MFKEEVDVETAPELAKCVFEQLVEPAGYSREGCALVEEEVDSGIALEVTKCVFELSVNMI